MKKSVYGLILSLLLANLLGDGPAEDKLLKVWQGNNQMLIPTVKESEAPAIDGVINAAEWSLSQKSAGFVREDQCLVPGKRGFIYLCRDARYLYIAVRTSALNNDPGGGLTANAKEHDGSVYNDDSIEVLLVADKDANTVYQIIVNSGGAVFDQKMTVDPKNHDVKWNIPGMKIGTRAESGWWDLELAIPLAEIGDPAKGLKMNIGRNWVGIGTSALNATKSYADQKNMVNIYWSGRPEPMLHQNELGDFEEGAWKIRLAAENPTGRTCVMAVMLRHYLFPKVNGKVERKMIVDGWKEVVVPPNGRAELELDAEAGDNVPRWFTSLLYDQKTGQVLYARLVRGKKQVSLGRHPATATFELGKIGAGACWYYPGYNRAAVRLNFYSAFSPTQVFVTVNGGEPQAAAREGNYYRILIPVGSTPGKYDIGVKAVGKDGKSHEFKSVCMVEKRSFPWEHNQYGKDKIILPPFTPLQAKERTVSGLMNSCRVNPFGLWDSLSAKGREILAAPMRLVMTADGKEVKWGRGTVSDPVVEDNGYLVRYKTSAVAADGVRLDGELVFEYDGFAWVKLSLDGIAGRKIDRLKLEIPLKGSEAPLFHAISNTIRSNPAGRLPSGEGEVWNGTQLKRNFPFGQENMHPQLVPYIWLGGVERGFSWFLDSSFGYKLDRKKSAVRVIRRGDTVLLEVDLINRPSQLKNGAFFEFGMQPTPVKPVDPVSRGFTRDPRGNGVKGLTNVMTVSGHLLGFPYNWSKVPYNEDYSLFREVVKTIRDGAHPDAKALMKPWFDKYGAKMYEDLKRVPNGGKYPEHLQQVRENFRKLTLESPERSASIPIKYSDPRLTYMMDEVPEYFKSEWWNPSPQGYFGAWRTSLVPSNMDYLMYGYYRELENGMHGIYLDDVFLMPEPNPDTEARIDDEGEVHSQIGILALRELVKRISVLQHQMNRYPRVLEVHMTNALLVPCFSLATSQLGWESNFGETPLPERYALDDVQAISLGTQIGADSLALGGILRKTTPPNDWKPKFERLSRSHLALTLPHDVKIKDRLNSDVDRDLVFGVYQKMSDFGCWNQDSHFVPYWENDAAFKSGHPGIVVSSYRRPGQVLAIVSNLKGDGETALDIDWSKLGLKPGTPVVDLENGKVIDPHKLSIPEYDYRLLRIGDVK